MPQLETFYLSFRAGLHVGRHGIGQEEAQAYVPSDTLFAALVTARTQLQGDAGKWAERFQGQPPPFRLTSAFPYAGGVRFYPRPAQLPQGMDAKKARKVRWVSEKVLTRLLAGDAPRSLWPPEQDRDPMDGLALQNGAMWLLCEEIEQLPEAMRTKREAKTGSVRLLSARAVQRRSVWAEQTVPRVTVDRITNTSEVFHTGRVAFAPECGLWFGVAWNDRNEREGLLECLRMLGDAGIGAERSAGYGAFTFGEGEVRRWNDPQPGGLMMLLSRYHPRREEATEALVRAPASYDLVRVVGHTRTPGVADQRRRGVWMVAEGSLIGGAAQGALANVKRQVGQFPHDIWRYGLALGIGWGGRQV